MTNSSSCREPVHQTLHTRPARQTAAMPERGFISRPQDASSAQSQVPGQLLVNTHTKVRVLENDTLPTWRKTKKLNQAWKHVFANPSYSVGWDRGISNSGPAWATGLQGKTKTEGCVGLGRSLSRLSFCCANRRTRVQIPSTHVQICLGTELTYNTSFKRGRDGELPEIISQPD